MEIYLAILEDHHRDIRIEPFIKIINALKKITEWQSHYNNEEWEEEEIESWEYYVRSSCDDGPKMRIEKKELR